MRDSGALPTYLVAGCAKSGTTSLHFYLGLHPEIGTSAAKELRFFLADPGPDELRRWGAVSSGNWHRGLDWYSRNFDPSFSIRGEASPEYSSPLFAGTAERIHGTLGPIRLIFCVRDPVERALAHWHEARDLGRERRPAEEAVDPGSIYVEGSRYARLLEPFLQHWPISSILVIDQHELATNRATTLASVFSFLGADPGYADPRFAEELNRGASKSGPAYRAVARLRRLPGWPRLASAVPSSHRPRLDRVLDGGDPELALADRTISAARRRELEAVVRADVERLRALTGQRFASWAV